MRCKKSYLREEQSKHTCDAYYGECGECYAMATTIKCVHHLEIVRSDVYLSTNMSTARNATAIADEKFTDLDLDVA